MSRVKLLLVMMLTMLGGCAENTALIKVNSTSMRTDIFEELCSGGIAVPSGFSDLRITATLKTHKPGIYSASDIHGTSDYLLLLNIDGQALPLRGSMQKEKSEPMKLVDPEAGDGIRYRFGKNLRLKAGTHRVVVALPDEGIAVEREITLTEGSINDLILEPTYNTKPGTIKPWTYNVTGFMEGIKMISLRFNGRDL